MIVSGAGLQICNGSYIHSGTYIDRPTYDLKIDDQGSRAHMYALVSRWHLVLCDKGKSVLGYQYSAPVDLTCPNLPPMNGWLVDKGTFPAPTVTTVPITVGDADTPGWVKVEITGNKVVFTDSLQAAKKKISECDLM